VWGTSVPAPSSNPTAEGSSTTAPTKTYYHTNHQGSVIAMADATGNATGCAAGVNCQRLSYDEYGRLGAGSVTTGQPYRYTGRRFDEETKLYYYRARYYSPGRFLQTDPIGYEDDVNLYAYVGNDPLNRIDPTGKAAFLAALPWIGGAALKKAVVFITTATVAGIGAAAVINEAKNDNGNAPPADAPSSSDSSELGPKPTSADEAGVSKGVQEKIPPEWGEGQPNRKKEGWRWEDPNDPGNRVRWDKGNPDSPWPSQQEDHVRVDKRGKVIGPDGKPIDPSKANPSPSKTGEAHIPSEDYEKWKSWCNPFC